MDTLYLNCGTPLIGEKTRIKSKADYLLVAAERAGITCVERWNESVKDPKYVLNIQPYHDDYQHVKFRKGTRWTGSWEIDTICNRQRMLRFFDEINTVFLTNKIKWYTGDKEFKYLHEACDMSLYKEYPEPIYDFVQCGTMGDLYYYKDFGYENIHPMADIYYERRRLYELLKHGYVVRFMGSNYPIEEHLTNLARARIQFIQSMHVMGENEIAQRFWESLPIGVVLTCYSPTLDDLDLIEDEDYLIFRNDKELLDKVERLIKDPELGRMIYDRGAHKVKSKHTYFNRLDQLLNYLVKNWKFEL